MKINKTIAFGADHPALPGHFPGDPLLPGVVILEAVEQLLAETLGPGYVARYPAVKFTRPLRPGEPVTLEAEESRPGGHYRFRVCSTEGCVAEGQLAWEAATP